MPEIQPIVSRLIAALTGHRCPACDRRSSTLVCTTCAGAMPGAHTLRCIQCALPLASGKFCGACLKAPPYFDASYAAFDFATPASTLIKCLKFHQMPAVAHWFALSMMARLPLELSADFIIPVPLSTRRLRERGFNQAWILAQALSQQGRVKNPLKLTSPYMQFPLPRWDLASRVIDTPIQRSLDRLARQTNMRGVFLANHPEALVSKHVLLVDDVMTTGATLNELARTLKQAGANRVSCAVACRTV